MSNHRRSLWKIDEVYVKSEIKNPTPKELNVSNHRRSLWKIDEVYVKSEIKNPTPKELNIDSHRHRLWGKKEKVMSSYKQIFYQIIFSTKFREPTINEEHCEELYKYIWGVIKNKKCKLYRINGVEDHIHIFSDLHPSISLSDYVKDIKVSSSLWMKESGLFPEFKNWQVGYGAFTYTIREKDKIINYVKKQKEHHKKENFIDEYKRILKEQGIEFDEKYLL